MRIRLLYFVLVILFAGCAGGLSLTGSSGVEPQVISVEPADGKVIDNLNEVKVTFSCPIDRDSVSNQSFLILPASTADVSSLEADQIADDIEAGDLVSLDGSYTFSENGAVATWHPLQTLNPQETYQIILTTLIRSHDRYPLNQTPGSGPTFFISQFTLKGSSVEAGDDPLSADQSPLTPAQLVINEIYYDDTVSDTDGNLFVELYGTPNSSLAGYSIRFVNGADGAKTDDMVFEEGIMTPEDGFFVVADSKTGSDSETNVASADYVDNFDPQNGPDSIQLLDPSGVIVDVVGYGEGMVVTDADGHPLYETQAAVTVESGQSLSRLAMADTGNNSVDFVVNTVPSPGTGDVIPLTVDDSPPPEGDPIPDPVPEPEPDPAPISILDDVHFTEVVTDPQQDWNDSAGGNGIPFDSFVGTGTIGSTDEWIEIKNGRAESVDLTAWRLEMLDGTDETELFSSSSASLIFSAGGDTTNFQPDEFLVIGNPAGDIKNTITIELFNQSDESVDELIVRDANATEIADESYQLMDDGSWGMGEASIGF